MPRARKQRPVRRSPGRLASGHLGFALLEVLVGSLIVAIAATGLALMLSSAHAFIVAQGDNRVAMYLAQQRIEEQIYCGASTATPCVQPTAGAVHVTDTVVAGLEGTQVFTRVMCINYVLDTDPTQPAGCTNCAGPGCTTLKRITVTVTPAQARSDPLTVQTVYGQ